MGGGADPQGHGNGGDRRHSVWSGSQLWLTDGGDCGKAAHRMGLSGFLDRIEDSSSIEAIYNTQNSLWLFMDYFLIHGLEDNYLLDAESGRTYFDSDEFRRVLRLGMKYCTEKEYIESVGPMLDGKVFCNIINVSRPEHIDMYRCYYGEDANYIGFPAREGSAHYIYGNDPIAIRSTATDEEKRVAGAFAAAAVPGESERMPEGAEFLDERALGCAGGADCHDR